ncbi:MAG: type III pantothenate kinase [Bacteroidetes bacterium]|nr:type III pantothenate kinase [Bacteroidota bacterium]
MNLILDLGNTNKKMALTNPDGSLYKVASCQKISLKIVQSFAAEIPGIEACILSSVIRHPLFLTRWLKTNFRFIELTEETPIPVVNLYRTPKELGKDRLAAAVAGASLFPGEYVLIIVAGTCITYNLVSAEKEFLGGAISPGMQMRFQSLHTFTGKLPLLSFTGKEGLVDPLGMDTKESIIAGVIHGIVSEMEWFASLYREKYPGLKVILGGGDLIYFNKLLKISIFASPNIVLQGLHEILVFNV